MFLALTIKIILGSKYISPHRKNAASSAKSTSPPSEAQSKWVSAAHRASKKSGSGFLSKQAAILGVGVKSGKGLGKPL